MTEGLPRLRRIVVVDEDGRSKACMDGVPTRTVTDPARPGFACTRYWVTEGAPTRLRVPLGEPAVPFSIEPPPNGAACYVVTFPPDSGHADSVTAEDVRRYFLSVGAPHASTASQGRPHPYMQRMETLDLCVVLFGTITLVLDVDEVDLRVGDTVIQRATNHAWSNRSDGPCVIAYSSHDARVRPSAG